MHTEPHTEVHHKPRHLAEKFEGMIGVIMVAAIVLLAVGLVYGVMTTGGSDPSWMK
jgi:cell division protein FtsL